MGEEEPASREPRSPLEDDGGRPHGRLREVAAEAGPGMLMMRHPFTVTRLATAFCLPCWGLAATGCGMVSGEEHRAVQKELLTAQERIEQLERELAQEQQAVRTLQKQQALQLGVAGDPETALIVPVRIDLERSSGGLDSDGQVGDEGLVLYVQPIDRDGHVVKAAGSLSVTLLDLANPADRHVLAEYHFDPAQTRGLWYGRMWTHHFTARCPWPDGRRPAHPEITAHVVFKDLLTGRSLTAQGVYRVVFPLEQAAGSTTLSSP